MFTQNSPTDLIRGHDRDVRAGRKPTSGGSSETDVNEPIDSPTGPVSVSARRPP